jgi:Fic family protein
MTWLWTHKNWPHFTWDADILAPLEARFLHASGRLAGTWRHFADIDRLELQVDWLTKEALETSAIEGEILNRESVQSSVRRQFGLQTDARRSEPAEAGIAEMMVQLYQSYDNVLTSETLFEWHRMIMNGRRDVEHIGQWRCHNEAMQVVFGAVHAPRIHYEAPPSDQMETQMRTYIAWFNQSHDLPALTRAGIAHFYFVCVHPFEDGNGRIGRALAEKSLAQSLKQPSLIALSQTISKERKRYYNALHEANHSLEITDFLVQFGQLILDAQQYSEHKLIRLIDKAQMFDRLNGQLNPRQEKALLRLFRAEPEGFKGGLSSANYRQITGTTIPTATRDLSDLINKGALIKTGEKRYRRYFLNLPELDC